MVYGDPDLVVVIVPDAEFLRAFASENGRGGSALLALYESKAIAAS